MSKADDIKFTKWWQEQLNKLGADLKVTGRNNKNTQAFVRQLQSQLGLKENGLATAETITAVKSAVEAGAIGSLNVATADAPVTGGVPTPRSNPRRSSLIAETGDTSFTPKPFLGAGGPTGPNADDVAFSKRRTTGLRPQPITPVERGPDLLPAGPADPGIATGANSPFAEGQVRDVPVEETPVSPPADFTIANPPEVNVYGPTPLTPGSERTVGMFSPEARATLEEARRGDAKRRMQAEHDLQVALDAAAARKRASLQGIGRAYLPTAVEGESDVPPPIVLDSRYRQELDAWYESHYDAVDNDVARDRIVEPIFDETAKVSPLVGANGKNVGDKWRTLQALKAIGEQAQREAVEGKVGLPGGKTYESVPEAIVDYGRNVGKWIAESIVTPAEGAEAQAMTREEAMKYLRGEESMTTRSPAELIPPPKEPGPLDALWPFLRETGNTLWISTYELLSYETVIGGIRDAMQEFIEFADETLDTAVAATGGKTEPLKGKLPEIDQPTTVPAQIERSLIQFLVGFAAGGKALKMLGWSAAAGGKTVQSARFLTQAFMSDFGFFDPKEEWIADMIKEWPVVGRNAVTEYLATDPNDSAAEGRLKHGLQGIVMAPLIPVFTRALRVMRRFRSAKGAGKAGTTVATEAETVAAESRILGDPDAPLMTPRSQAREAARKLSKAAAETEAGVPDDVVVRSLTDKGLTPLGNGEVYVNFARINTADDIKRIIQDSSTALKESVDEARRGVRTHAQTKAAAEDIDAFNLLITRRAGQAYNAEELTAARDLWIGAARKLEEVIDVAANAPTPENLYAFRTMFSTFHAIQKEVLGASAEAGRALNALKIPAGLGNKERMLEIERIVNELGGMDANADMVRMVQILARTNKKGLVRYADRASGARTMNAMQQLFYGSILSSPKTQMRNIVSTGAMIPLRMAQTAVAARAGRILGRDLAENPVMVGEAAAQWAGIKMGWRRALQYVGTTWRASAAKPGQVVPDIVGKYGFKPREHALSAEALGMRKSGLVGRAVGGLLDGLDWFTRYSGRALMSVDAGFKSINHDMTIWQEAYKTAQREIAAGTLTADGAAARMAEIIARPNEALRIQAQKDALHWTFNDPPGRVVSRLLKLRNTGMEPDASIAERLGGYWARITLPFINTPANLWSRGLEHTPLAPLFKTYRDAIAKGGGAADLARTKIALGTMYMATFVDMAADGLITGAGPSPGNPAEYGEYLRWQRENKTPYSIKIGDKWVSFRGLEPWSTLAGWAATISEWTKRSDFTDPDEEFDLQSAIAYSAFSLFAVALDASFMTGAADFSAAVDDPSGRSASYLKRYLSAYTTPALVRDIGQAIDPTYRFTTNFLQDMRKKWGFGQDYAPVPDAWGRALTSESGVGFLYDMVSPFRARTGKQEPIDAAMERDGWSVWNPPKKFTILGQDIKLTGDRYPIYWRFMNLRGQTKPSAMPEIYGQLLQEQFGDLTMLETLNAIVTGQHELSPQYAATIGPEGREAMIKRVISAYRNVAKAIVLDEHPELIRDAIERNERMAARGELEVSPFVEQPESEFEPGIPLQ